MSPPSSFKQEALETLSNVIQGYVDREQNYGASIVVARGGKVGFRKTFGTIAAEGRSITNKDVFSAMSLSKSFSAFLALRAVDKGILTLDTKIADILPYFGAAGKQHVTVRQILTHTAGLFPGFVPPSLSFEEATVLETYVKAIAAIPVAYKPATQCCYCPASGFAVLAQVLVVTDPQKRSFSEIAHQELFEPLGMTETSFGLNSDHPRRVPISFRPEHQNPASANLKTVIDSVTVEVIRGRGSTPTYRLISPTLFEYANRIHTGDLVNHAWDYEVEQRGLGDFLGNFTLMGGYGRGTKHHLGFSQTASPRSFCAVGGGSTWLFVDPERELTVAFLSAGFIPGLRHFERLQKINDLALAALE